MPARTGRVSAKLGVVNADDSAPEILALSAPQVCKLTGLSLHQLSYWDRTGFFSPAYASDRRSPVSRVYSFRDVVGLRALADMRKQHHIPLQTLRQVGKFLSDHYDEPWSRLTFYIVGKQVYYSPGEAQRVRSADKRAQTVLPFAMSRVEHQIREAIATMRARSPAEIGHTMQNRYVAENKRVLAGTRTPTSAIWDFHEAGYSDEQILREYPRLKKQDIRAAVEAEREQRAKTA